MSTYFTPEKVDISNKLWAVTSGVGGGFCFIVLVVITALYIRPAARAHMDRVSFRIMLYSLIANMFFGIAGAVAGAMTGPSIVCGLAMFLLQLTLQLSSFLLFSIGLNLQLVVVHGMRGGYLEKYYVASSIVMALSTTIPPYAAGQYGWDPLEKQCWYTDDDHQQRLAWQVGTQFIWTGLTVSGEVVTACIVTIYMLRVQYRRKHVLSVVTRSRSSESSSYQQESGPRPSSILPLKPTSMCAYTYAGVIFRIALYPFASCVINLTTIGSVIPTTSTNGVRDANDYRIVLLSDVVYGGRPIVYALLAATDPAVVRALRALVTHSWKWRRGDLAMTRFRMVTTGPSGTASRARHEDLAVQVELSTVVTSDFPSGGDPADDAKAQDMKTCSAAAGACDDDHTVLPAPDKAERGTLADSGVGTRPGTGTSEPPHNSPRPVTFELTSPITPLSQSIRRRRDDLAREQAEKDEFMRII